MIYLDYNATTPVHPEVRQVIDRVLELEYGNPSSSHAKGRAAKAIVDRARAQLADSIGCRVPAEIVFTGSAMEADNLAVLEACMAASPARRHLVVSAVEHPAVMAPALHLQRVGWQLSVAPVHRDGRVDLDALGELLGRAPTALVSVMLANNELGTLQPVDEVGELARRAGALFHIDAAQAMGKVVVDVGAIGADLLTLAGHKMYAPKGIGALFVRRGTPLQPLMFGATQEGGICPGTENVAYIAGLGAAAQLVAGAAAQRTRMGELRDRFQQLLLSELPGLTVNGSQEHRLPNTLHASLPSGSARALIEALSNEVALSSGAACHSDMPEEPSGVMKAIGATAQQAHGALRLSLGFDTTADEIERAAKLIATAHRRLESGRRNEA